MKARLGCVPFLNAKPLIELFAAEEDLDAEVTFASPSLLGDMVDNGDVDAAIASSFFAISDPTLKIAAGVSISSRGPVRSVRMFSKVPFSEINSLALDAASMTSNHLALIILAEEFGVRPKTDRRTPDLDSMLESCDAAILIGDAGMAANGHGLYVLDLGQEWSSATGLPFVWAAWVGRDGLTENLAGQLRNAKDYGVRHIEEVAVRASQELDWPYATCLNYLTESIDFDLDAAHLKGFELFGKKCVQMGFVEDFRMPPIVGDACANPATS
jgi:chorismate dehydratase